MEVNKENMRLFIEALRSGEYRQVINNLARKVDDEWRHCCLGVACEVALKHGVELNVEEKTIEYTSIQEERTYRIYDQTSGVLPDAVVSWLGINSNDPALFISDEGPDRIYATVLNDGHLWTFEQIADAFERTFLKENNEDSSDPA